MKRSHPTLFLIVTLALAATITGSPSSAQGALQDKSYTQWTTKEAEKLLTDSPWAQTATNIDVAVRADDNNNNTWTLRLRSALPIRQALLRYRQLQEKYEQMSEAKKKAFDEKNRPLVDCPACVDNYVVALMPPPGGYASTIQTLNKMSQESLKLYVRLANERGETRDLVHATLPKSLGQEIVFFFSRHNDKGEPLLTVASKKLIFTVDAKILGGSTSAHRFEFDVSKMIVNSEVAF